MAGSVDISDSNDLLEAEDWQEFKSRAAQTPLRILGGSVTYPFLYTKTLMQFGYEPLPLCRGRRFIWFGGNDWFLPNQLVYMQHISNKRGALCLYKGLSTYICAQALGTVAAVGCSMYLDKRMPALGGGDKELETTDNRKLSDEQSLRRMVRIATRESVAKSFAIIITRPFNVVMARQIAQFVGDESVYEGVLHSLSVIYKEEGLPGLFSGLMPNLIYELGTLWATHSLLFTLDMVYNKYILEDPELDSEDEAEEGAVSSSRKMMKVVVPFIVNSLILALAQQPYLPTFGSWQDCHKHLTVTKGRKRGAGMFLRAHKGRITRSGNHVYAVYTDY